MKLLNIETIRPYERETLQKHFTYLDMNVQFDGGTKKESLQNMLSSITAFFKIFTDKALRKRR